MQEFPVTFTVETGSFDRDRLFSRGKGGLHGVLDRQSPPFRASPWLSTLLREEG